MVVAVAVECLHSFSCLIGGVWLSVCTCFTSRRQSFGHLGLKEVHTHPLQVWNLQYIRTLRKRFTVRHEKEWIPNSRKPERRIWHSCATKFAVGVYSLARALTNAVIWAVRAVLTTDLVLSHVGYEARCLPQVHVAPSHAPQCLSRRPVVGAAPSTSRLSSTPSCRSCCSWRRCTHWRSLSNLCRARRPTNWMRSWRWTRALTWRWRSAYLAIARSLLTTGVSSSKHLFTCGGKRRLAETIQRTYVSLRLLVRPPKSLATRLSSWTRKLLSIFITSAFYKLSAPRIIIWLVSPSSILTCLVFSPAILTGVSLGQLHMTGVHLPVYPHDWCRLGHPYKLWSIVSSFHGRH